ncbi:MAG TPA: hydroxymethylbilane synthase [Spirochaetota bacterium]|nr:hydroxymethylbilane synthase [Spirochaetota bacterium]HPP94678.1 hydroxymethylbilane synthase [Spirochaetota bacterium]
MGKKIRIGTRGSELALWQANYIADLIGRDKVELVIIKTAGDRIQNVSFNKMEGKGFFTKEIEEALLQGKVDLAVHSLKDLPTEEVKGLKLAAIPQRGDFHDLLIMHRDKVDNSKLPIKKGSKVGTSSMRRLAQLKLIEPSLVIEPLRGNVNTRLRKLKEGLFDAIVMAKAGVERINLDVSEFYVKELSEDLFLPAPAQGALGLQIREDDDYTESIIKALNDPQTEKTVSAERAFLKFFGGGCHVPLGALAKVHGDTIILEGVVVSPDGTFVARSRVYGKNPEALGEELARVIKSKGADKYI